MMRRWILLVSATALGAGGAFGIACSNKPIDPGDAGDDASMQPDTTGGMDANKPDMGMQGMKCPSYPVKGECDLVAQDCMPGQECALTMADGGYTSKCQQEGTGTQPKGGTCTSSSNCVPGTECQMGRCAPFCCQGDPNADQKCGMSPDSKPGICNLTLVDKNNKTVGYACTYSDDCKPFQVVPCPMGSACLIQDMSGKATCTQINPMPGLDEGKPCSFANECKDGMYCINSLPDGGGACAWGCYLGNGPYDAGIKNNPPGQGGCPKMPKAETCKIMVQGLPNWFGICAP